MLAMPELPEVESLRQLLEASLIGRIFVSASVREPRLRRSLPPEFATTIRGRKVERLDRRAKYLIFALSGAHRMIVHLGMSGSLSHRRDAADAGPFNPRHDHVQFDLDDGSQLVYNDPRRFGLMKLYPDADFEGAIELKGLGPEPFDGLTADALWLATRGRTVAIKNLLMDQRVVAGVGNIYASEILFRARVRPTRRGGRVTRAELERIAAITPQVLLEAIGSRGTTFRSYRDSSGQPGRFSSQLRVYDRAGMPCLECSKLIRSVIVGQRSSFYCPQCQK
ncbi:MAG TPA: bifunctional DNA-formamidopyrimidine glycosylase/DNA-(apurinic or apyrimidinic site) lyase [Candidatus Binataceae bacterium]|nr:bifunctional DNA-formamidopyrimidine glycosylase/DNA-(apurinic or apyrimidinic site) lyase [Candidatus Binataceae bacterium]